MTSPQCMRLPLKLVPWLCLLLIATQSLCLARDTSGCTQPTLEAMDKVACQTMSLTNYTYKPSKIDLDGKRILWVTGLPGVWSVSNVEKIQRWVARGNVCWVDVNLAPAFGLAASVGGSVQEAIVAEGSGDHPLVQGVKSIKAKDTFTYMRGLPEGADPILVSWNRSDHVVVAVWPVEMGAFVVIPRKQPNTEGAFSPGQRHWIELNVADGRRFTHNLHLFTLDVLDKAHPLPAPGLKPDWAPQGLLSAFGGVGGGCR